MGCYRQDMVVCTEDNVRGVVEMKEGAPHMVTWDAAAGEDVNLPLLDGWRLADGRPVWPMRLASAREMDVMNLLDRCGPLSTTVIEARLGLRGLSSALSRLKTSGHVTYDRKSARWSPCSPEYLHVRVRQDVQRPPVEAATVAEAAGEASALFGHVELGGEQMLLVPVDADAGRIAHERGLLLAEVSAALGCDRWEDAGAWARALASAQRDARQLLDRVAAVLGGSWEEAVGKVEALRAERERALIAVRERDEALANARTIPDTLHTHITREKQRADTAVASLRGVCKALGCEPADVEDVVARLVAERGNLRRELGAAEQVERALLKALADAGAALAREQATALVNTVRARDMRRGEG